jgi:hypothetical protein
LGVATSGSNSNGGRDFPGAAQFGQTQWSVVLAAAGKKDVALAQESLESFARFIGFRFALTFAGRGKVPTTRKT